MNFSINAHRVLDIDSIDPIKILDFNLVLSLSEKSKVQLLFYTQFGHLAWNKVIYSSSYMMDGFKVFIFVTKFPLSRNFSSCSYGLNDRQFGWGLRYVS